MVNVLECDDCWIRVRIKFGKKEILFAREQSFFLIVVFLFLEE